MLSMLDDHTRGVVDDFLATLPCTTFAFAYGSAAFSQGSADVNKTGSSSMLDVILFVNDAEEWHNEVRSNAASALSETFWYPVPSQ
jgi:hypothetical protein